MTYQTTITRKGQITIPKPIRDFLRLDEHQKLIVEIQQNDKVVRIRPAENFLKIARQIRVRKKINPVKARRFLEKFYERV